MELMLNDAQVAYAEAIIEAGLIDIDEVNQWLGSLTEVPLDLGALWEVSRDPRDLQKPRFSFRKTTNFEKAPFRES